MTPVRIAVKPVECGFVVAKLIGQRRYQDRSVEQRAHQPGFSVAMCRLRASRSARMNSTMSMAA